MLEVATLPSPNPAVFSLGDHHVDVGFPEGEDDFLLDYIDFSTCDVPFFHVDDGDILPDLEVDPTELLAEFADEPATTTVLSPAAEPAATDGCGVQDGGVDEAKTTTVEMESPAKMDMELPEEKGESKESEKEDVKHSSSNNVAGDEVWSAVTTDDSSAAVGSDAKSSASAEGHSKRTSKPASSASAKNSHGRRKVKEYPAAPPRLGRRPASLPFLPRSVDGGGKEAATGWGQEGRRERPRQSRDKEQEEEGTEVHRPYRVQEKGHKSVHC